MAKGQKTAIRFNLGRSWKSSDNCKESSQNRANKNTSNQNAKLVNHVAKLSQLHNYSNVTVGSHINTKGALVER